jgi:hypothetical protein
MTKHKTGVIVCDMSEIEAVLKQLKRSPALIKRLYDSANSVEELFVIERTGEVTLRARPSDFLREFMKAAE